MKKWLIVLFSIVLAGACALPAAAADWELYGSARVATYWEKIDADASTTDFERTDTYWDLQGNSRIGAKVREGNVAGRFEYGTGVNLRLLYAALDFDKATVLVGQDYTPLYVCISNQIVWQDLGLGGWGTTFGRKPMLKLETGGLSFALVKPDTDDLDVFNDVQVVMPSIEASYTYKADQFDVRAIGGYSTYQVVDTSDDKENIDRYIFGLSGTYYRGPVYLAAQGHVGQNLGTWKVAAAWTGASSADPIVNANGNIKDNFGYGYAVELGYIFNDRISTAAGLGGVSYKVDATGYDDDRAMAYYLNTKIKITQTAFVVPEVGYFDMMDDAQGNSEGNVMYAGAKWQVDF